MITAERIHNWLQKPHLLKEIAPAALKQLTDSYPYFAIARLLKAVQENDAGENNLLRCLYNINPVLLRELQSGFDTAIAEEGVAAEAAAYTEETERVAETLAVEPEKDSILRPVSADDYFLHQGIKVSSEIPAGKELTGKEKASGNEQEEDREQSLLVMMSFSEWLSFISAKNKKEKEEEAEQKALKMLWQQQKLAAAIEEENEEIPEKVFEMAVNSIAPQDGLASESLAEVYTKQGKIARAIEMYQKLILLNPEKSVYFARKIEALQKEI